MRKIRLAQSCARNNTVEGTYNTDALRATSELDALLAETELVKNFITTAHPIFVTNDVSQVISDLIWAVNGAKIEVNMGQYFENRLPFDRCLFDFENDLPIDGGHHVVGMEAGTENGADVLTVYSLVVEEGCPAELIHKLKILQDGIHGYNGPMTVHERLGIRNGILTVDDILETRTVAMGWALKALRICATMAIKNGPFDQTEEALYPRNLARRMDREKLQFRDPKGEIPKFVRVDLSPSGKQHLEIMQDEALGEKGGVRIRAHWVRGHLMRTERKGLVWRKAHVRGFGDAALRPHVVTIKPERDEDPDMEMAI
jgi:hypothetical protein